MEILRTPNERFKDLKTYPFEPHYTTIKTHDDSDLRIHHIDEGDKGNPIILCMHGQPVWSYLYARMIPYLNEAGIRVIAPDLPGYGKSDKPAAREDYTYQRQVDWMSQWLEKNNFSDLTFFGQDWGGLIGLRMVVENPDRFIKIAMGNTGLPYNPDTPQEIIDEVRRFRQSKIKVSLMSMAKQVIQMDKGGHPALKFMYWQKFCWDAEDMPIGLMSSQMMEKRSKFSLAMQYLFQTLGFERFSPFTSELVKAYEAPFPDPSYKMGPRAMPTQVPIIPDASLEAQARALEFYAKFEKPFLSVFAGNDPVTNPIKDQIPQMVPNPIMHPDIGGGHFFQWTRAKELASVLVKFIKE